MGKQSSFKIILTTFIFLVIGLIGIFTYVNREEIFKRVQSAQSKSENIERHERNTVSPNTSTSILSEDSKTTPLLKNEKENPVEVAKVETKKDEVEKKAQLKTFDEYGIADSETKKDSKKDSIKELKALEAPKALNKKETSKSEKKQEDEKEKLAYPESEKDSSSKEISVSNKKSSKKEMVRKHPKVKKGKGSKKLKNLEKRVSKLEKKLGVKKTSKKKPNLEKRVTRLEKIVKKKK